MPALWLPVPHHKQNHPSDCLAACAAMLLDYAGRPVPYDRLLQLLDITPDLGAPASNIKRLMALNVTVEYGPGNITDLAHRLAQGVPAIAFVHTIHLS